MFLSKIHVDSFPSGNGHDGVKIMTVTVDSGAMFYLRKQSRLEEGNYSNSINLFPGI